MVAVAMVAVVMAAIMMAMVMVAIMMVVSPLAFQARAVRGSRSGQAAALLLLLLLRPAQTSVKPLRWAKHPVLVKAAKHPVGGRNTLKASSTAQWGRTTPNALDSTGMSKEPLPIGSFAAAFDEAHEAKHLPGFFDTGIPELEL